jgi:hypothetical protein
MSMVGIRDLPVRQQAHDSWAAPEGREVKLVDRVDEETAIAFGHDRHPYRVHERCPGGMVAHDLHIQVVPGGFRRRVERGG